MDEGVGNGRSVCQQRASADFSRLTYDDHPPPPCPPSPFPSPSFLSLCKDHALARSHAASLFSLSCSLTSAHANSRLLGSLLCAKTSTDSRRARTRNTNAAGRKQGQTDKRTCVIISLNVATSSRLLIAPYTARSAMLGSFPPIMLRLPTAAAHALSSSFSLMRSPVCAVVICSQCTPTRHLRSLVMP